MALVIRQSQIHADGVYTTTAIKKRAIVAEYTGPRLTNSQADDIYEHSPRTYLFGLVDGEHVIDGDGIAAFINHCCDPNLESRMLRGHILYFSKRPIKKGEELTVDYHFSADEEIVKCKCGAKSCRGTINLAEVPWRRR